MERSRDTHAQDAAVEEARLLAQRLRRQLQEMGEMTGTDGKALFSAHVLRLAADSVDAADRYVRGARTRRETA